MYYLVFQIELTVFRQKVGTDPVRPDGNTRQWMLRYSRNFTNILQVLQIIHSVPATSVMSERVFSKVGLILANKLRNRFDPLFICKIIYFLRLTAKKIKELLLVSLNSAAELVPENLFSDDELINDLANDEMIDEEENA